MLPTNAVLQMGGGANKYQVAIAVGVLAAAALALAIGAWRTQYTGLSSEGKRHKSTIRAQYDAKTPTSLKLPIDADFRAERSRIRSLWSDYPEIDDHTTVREALRKAHLELLDSWRSVTDRVPRLAIWLLEEGAVVLVLGALAVMSIEQWEDLFSSGRSGYGLETILSGLVSLTQSLVDAGFTVLGLFPYGNVVWSLALGYGMLAYQLLYEHWYVVGLLLLVGGVVLVVLDRYTPSVDASLHLRDRELGYRIVRRVVTVWAVGAVPVALASAADAGTAGAIVGFLCAFVLALYYALAAVVGTTLPIWDWARGWWATRNASTESLEPDDLFPDESEPVDPAIREAFGHLEHDPYQAAANLEAQLDGTGHDWRGISIDWVAGAYITACRAYATVAAVAATLIPVYLVVIVANGRLFDVWAAFSAGSTDMKAVVGLLAAGVVAVVAYEIQDAWPDLRASVGHVLSSKSVRLALFGRAMPFGVVLIGYLVALGLFQSVVVAAALAVGAGVLARLGYLLLMRARYRMELFEAPEQQPRRVLIDAYTLEDADGCKRYVATVNRERIARDSVDALVDEILEQSETLAENAEYADTFGRHYADHLFEFGIVGEANSRKKLRERVRKVVYAPLKKPGNHSRVEETEIDDDLAEYPDSIVDERLQTFRVNGTRDGRVFRRDGYYVLER